MGFLKNRKIAKLIRNGMAQIDAENYSDAIRMLKDAYEIIITEINKVERELASLPSSRWQENISCWYKAGEKGYMLHTFLAATFYGIVLDRLGYGNKEGAEQYLEYLRGYDSAFAKEIGAKIEKREQLPRHYIPSDERRTGTNK